MASRLIITTQWSKPILRPFSQLSTRGVLTEEVGRRGLHSGASNNNNNNGLRRGRTGLFGAATMVTFGVLEMYSELL